LAPYGGPIFAPLAVGGYLQDDSPTQDILLATGLSLTFLINNNVNNTALKPAFAWEQK